MKILNSPEMNLELPIVTFTVTRLRPCALTASVDSIDSISPHKYLSHKKIESTLSFL